MAEVEYLHVCDYAFPAEGGKPCVVGIFDNIGAPSFPMTHPYMAVAFQLRGTPHEVVSFKVEIGRIHGTTIASLEGQVILGDGGAQFVSINLVNTAFPEAGKYTVKVSADGKALMSRPLQVVMGQHPGQVGPPPQGPLRH